MAQEAGPRVIPPGGFSYPETPGFPPLKAGSKEELIDAITQDRIANGRPVGDPENDFREHVIRNYPDHSGAVTMDRPPISPDAVARNLRERVTQWAATRYAIRAAGGPDLVSQEEADRRASICASCPANQAPPDDCAPCIKNNERTAFLLRQGKSTKVQVAACSITGQDNQSACFMPKEMLNHRGRYLEELKEKTPHCWLIDL